MQSDNNSKDATQAMLIGFLMVALALPLIIDKLLLPYYTYAWYWFKFYVLQGAWTVATLPIVGKGFDYIFSYVQLFLWDFDFKSGQLTTILTQSLDIMLQVDSSSPNSVLASMIGGDGSISNKFDLIGRFTFALIAPVYIFILYKYWSYLRAVKTYTTVFTLDSFAEQMAEAFPELLPVVFDNPQKWGSLDEGPWRMSPKVYDYMKSKDCLKFTDVRGGQRFTINEKRVMDIMVNQLGSKWTGYDGLPKNYLRIAATAMPMVVSPARGRDETNELIRLFALAHSAKPTGRKIASQALKATFSLSTYVSKKGLGLSGLIKLWASIPAGIREGKRQRLSMKKGDALVKKCIEKYSTNPKVKKVISIHAYNLTVVASLIEAARLGGVLPSCSALWLKVHDRNLFYAYNNLGRQVAWVEVAGFWSHFIAEKTVKMPFPYPKVANAVVGIDDYFNSSFDNYDPVFEHSD